jgi:hypothetical protein
MFYSIFLTSHARTCNINHRYSEVQQYSLHSREGTEQDSDSIHVLIVLKVGLLYEHSSPIIISSLRCYIVGLLYQFLDSVKKTFWNITAWTSGHPFRIFIWKNQNLREQFKAFCCLISENIRPNQSLVYQYRRSRETCNLYDPRESKQCCPRTHDQTLCRCYVDLLPLGLMSFRV